MKLRKLFRTLATVVALTGSIVVGGCRTTEQVMTNDKPLLAVDLSAQPPEGLAAALLSNPHITLAPGAGPGGADALRVAYVGDEHGSKRVVVRYPLSQRGNEMTLCFYVRFDEAFQFVKGGKLHGLGPDKPVTGGNAMRPDGWSARAMWREEGKLETYLYEQDKNRKYGSRQADDFRFSRGRYRAVSIHVRVNSASDSNDGFTHIYVDGVLRVRHDEVRFRESVEPGTEITQLLFSTFHGGNTPEWAPVDEQGRPVTVYAWFSGLAVYEGLHILEAAN